MAFDEIWQKAQEGIPLRYGVVDGADHDFTHRLEDFIALIDLL